MNLKTSTAACALLLALAAGQPALAQPAPVRAQPAAASAQLSEGVAAIVNDQVISTFDVRQRASLLLVSAGMQSTPELMQRARAQALSDLINEHLKLQETAKFDIDISDAEVDRQIADIAHSNEVTPEQLQGQLAQSGVSISTLRAQLEADIAWSRLVNGLYGSRIRISPLEVRATQERIAANATRPQYQISEIFLPAQTEQQFTDMQAGAARLLEQMQRGAPFPAIARQFSAAPSSAQGGDLGWIASTELAAELQPIAERLQPGQVSLPIRTPTGIYIIAMRDRRAGAPPGTGNVVTLRQVSAPASSVNALGRAQRRIENCRNLEGDISGVSGAEIADLGQTGEADLSPAVRARIANVAAGSASAVETEGDQASIIVVCAREAGGAGVPDATQVERRLREQELDMLAERYLRNLRGEAAIITR